MIHTPQAVSPHAPQMYVRYMRYDHLVRWAICGLMIALTLTLLWCMHLMQSVEQSRYWGAPSEGIIVGMSASDEYIVYQVDIGDTLPVFAILDGEHELYETVLFWENTDGGRHIDGQLTFPGLAPYPGLVDLSVYWPAWIVTAIMTAMTMGTWWALGNRAEELMFVPVTSNLP